MTTTRNNQSNPNTVSTTAGNAIGTSAQAVYDFSRAVLVGSAQGVGHAIVGMVDSILHPIDNVLYPVSSFLYDATLISAAHVNTVPINSAFHADHIDSAMTAIRNDPQLYRDAVTRMEGRINQLRTAGQNFVNAPWQEQVRMATMAITSMATNIYAPGMMINSVRAMANLQRFGVPYNPPTFQYALEPRNSFLSIPTYTLADVRALRGDQPCLYAITQNNRLIIAPQFVVETRMTRVGNTEVPRTTQREIKHYELTRCCPVMVAGEMKTTNGLITLLDNNSGRYLAYGAHLKSFTERFFNERGFTDALGKFTPSLSSISPLAIRVPSPMNFLPPAGVGAGVLNIIADGLRHQQEQQRREVQERSEREERRQHAANMYAESSARQHVIANTRCFNLPYDTRHASSINKTLLLWRAQIDAVWMFRLQYGNCPNYVEQQIRNQVHTCFSSVSTLHYSSPSMSEFSLSLWATNLVHSYNLCNFNSYIYSLSGYGFTGGVEARSGMIEDMINSDAHASADSYYLCFPLNTIPDNLFYQIQYELFQAYYKDGTFPFFSLHFNQNGFLYPVIHPAFQNTLIGQVIGLLDYWMKGYLNGGIFDEQFLKDWHEIGNCDEAFLRSKMIDLKKYCKEKLPEGGYISLRELESRYGVKDEKTHCAYQQPFKTAFRIITFLDRMERQDNVLVFHPDFRVEYSVDIMPDYQQYVDSYVKEHGELPPEYQKTLRCYEEFCEEIKEKMPKLEFCKIFFNLLGAMTPHCYLFPTLDKMGKRPEVDPPAEKKNYVFPKALPPIPIRYFRSYDLTITLKNILTPFLNSVEKTNLFNSALSQLFTTQGTLPEYFRKEIAEIIHNLVKAFLSTQLSPQELAELNEEEMNRIIHKSMSLIEDATHGLSSFISTQLQEIIQKCNILLPSSSSADLPLLEQIVHLQQSMENQFKLISNQWELLPDSAKNQAVCGLWQSSKNLIEEAMNLYEEIIPGKQANKEQELAKLTAQDKINNKVNIDIFVKKMDVEKDALARFNALVNLMKQIEVNQRELKLQEIASKMRKSMSSSTITINPIPELFNPEMLKTTKADIILALQKIKEHYCNLLTGSKELITGFLNRMMATEKFITQIVSNKYTHAFQSFSGKVTAEKTGDNFQIIGGCGVSLPNLHSTPIPHAELFCDAVAQSFTAANQKKGQFEHNGVVYTVYKLPVHDVEQEYKISTTETVKKDIALHLLDHVNQNQSPPETIALENIKTEVNESGATLMHYAAATLKPEHFASVLKTSQGMFKQADQYGLLPIHMAAQTGNVDAIRMMVEQDSTLVNVKSKRGLSPLMIAVQYGQLDVIQLLHSKGAEFNHTLPNGLFPLFMAIQKNFTPIALWMLDNVHNIEVNKSLNSQVTSLHLAVQNGASQLAQRLIEKGAQCDVRRKSDGLTPLHNAAKNGDIEVLKKMLVTAVSVNLVLESNKTPLHLAAEAGKLDAVKLLIERGALVDAKTVEDETALMLAIKAGEVETALWLATNKAAVNSINIQKQTASLLSLQYGMPQVGYALILRGENPSLPDTKGFSYLYYLLRNGEYHTLELMINRGISMTELLQGNSALALAAQFGHFLIVYALQEKKIPYHTTTEFTLMDYAVMADEIGYVREHYESVKNLIPLALLAIKSGASHCLDFILKKLSPVDCQNKDLLAAAIVKNDEKIVVRVLKHCKDINISLNHEGNTALHYAAQHGAHHALPKLAELGCQFSKVNHKNQTAFHIAVLRKDADFLERLLMVSITRPSDWPHDLWQMEKLDSKLKDILRKYENQLPKKNKAIEHKNQEPAAKTITQLSACPILTKEQRKIVDSFFHYISFHAFDKAAMLLEQHTILKTMFKSDQGGILLQRIFMAIKNSISVLSDPEKKSEKKLHVAPDKLLLALRKIDFNPSYYLGKHNVLLTMLKAESDEEACYRLHVFSHYFSESLPILAQDKIADEVNIMNLCFTKNYRQFFIRLDELCKKYSTTDLPYNGLHEAVSANRYEFVVDLLGKYSVHSINHKGQTPIMLAALNGHVPLINLLLKHGALVDQVDFENKNVLHYALNKPSQEAALTLLPLLKKPNQADRFGVTPFMLAAVKGVLPMMRVLYEQSHEIKAVDSQGLNALHHAALEGQVDSIKFLISRKFAVDQTEVSTEANKQYKCLKRTALHLAAMKGRVDAVLTLLERQANPELEDERGFALSEYAVYSKNWEMLKLVKLTPYYHNKNRNKYLLRAAVMVDHVTVLRELILDQINVNELSADGYSALHYAAMFNSGESASELLKSATIILDGVAHDGFTPLHVAAQYGHIRIIELLCTRGADINQVNHEGQSPLELAYLKHQYGAVVSLLRFGADVTKINSAGLTLAQVALLNGHFSYVKLFQEAGDDSTQLSAFTRLPELMRKQLEGALTIMMKHHHPKTNSLMKHRFYKPMELSEGKSSSESNTIIVKQ